MNDKQKPSIRFKGFTEAWEQRKLGEFGKATGGTSIESEFEELGKYKVISIGSYSETSKYTDQGIRANKTHKTESRILNKNDLTMILNDKTASGNIIGRVLLIDADDSYVFNQRTERIEVYENEYLPDFLYQLLNADNVREKIIRASQGNTQIYVNWTSISELSYEIPVSKHEQRKIADLFNQLDHLITLHQRKYDKLVNVKKSMLEKMFPRDGENVPEIRFAGFTEAWEQRKLGEFGKATGGTSIESEFEELGKYKVISIGSYSETSKYTDQGIRANKTHKTESRILNKNDLTMILNDKTASGNIIGRVLLIDADDSYVFNQRTERIEVYENEYLPDFLYQLLNADNVREKIIRASQGNTQIYVNWTSISELSYEIPVSKHEQRKIADLFNQLDHLITLHQREIEKLKNIKKSCLEKMFI